MADSLAARDSCGAAAKARALEKAAIAAVNGRRVPQALAEPLLSGAHQLVAAIRCVPPPPLPAGEDCRGRQGPKGKHGEKRRGRRHGRKKRCEEG